MKRIPNEETAAICGLFCGTCPCYPEDCHGCLSDKLTPACTVCGNGFRTCAKEHGVERCYECAEFPCGRLEEFQKHHFCNGIGHHEQVISDLKEMGEGGVDKWVEKQTKQHTCEKCGELIYWYDVHTHVCK